MRKRPGTDGEQPFGLGLAISKHIVESTAVASGLKVAWAAERHHMLSSCPVNGDEAMKCAGNKKISLKKHKNPYLCPS
jgi:hypothetical protein